jgi:hypothetical protein
MPSDGRAFIQGKSCVRQLAFRVEDLTGSHLPEGACDEPEGRGLLAVN